MGFTKLALLLTASLALGACGDKGIFGNGGGSGSGGSGETPGTIEESSIAYFNTTVGDTVLFPVDQATLTDEARAILDAQVLWLNRHPEHTIIVEGHADEQGTTEYNIALSNRRAVAVKFYLISQGLLESRITQVIPYGKARPLAICSNESCWSKNRRSVTVVAGGMGSA